MLAKPASYVCSKFWESENINMEIMIVFISIYNVNDNLLYLIFHGYCYDIFHICHKNWKIRENDTERYFILDLNAIPC